MPTKEMDRLYDLYPLADQIVSADELWLDCKYRSIACPECDDVLENFRTEPLAIDLDSATGPLKGPIVGIWNVHLKAVTRELADDLRLAARGFLLGEFLRDSKPIAEYVTVLATSGPRLLTCSSAADPGTTCPVCGRRFRRINWYNEWIKRAELTGRDVYCGMGGTGLLVTPSTLASIRPEVRAQLRTRVLPVRDE
jgi:hypothetical protein